MMVSIVTNNSQMKKETCLSTCTLDVTFLLQSVIEARSQNERVNIHFLL